jgi:hypothetical protein
LARISNALSPLSGLSPGDTEENVFEQITHLRRLLHSDQIATANLQRTYNELETVLAKYLDVQHSGQKNHAEFIQTLIRELSSRQTETKTVKTLAFRLAAIIGNESKPTGNPVKLLDILEERIRKERYAIESIAGKVFVDRSFDTPSLLDGIAEWVDHRASAKPSTPGGLDAMLLPIFERIPVTTRADYRVYIPEICTGVLSLHNSIMALKPFASTLNNIFTQFDCKLSSFCPGSAPYQFLKSQISALHSALNSLVPTKINSIVFLVLSRFVALFSLLTSALTASAFDKSDQSMKKEFYALQQALTNVGKWSK